MKRKSKKMLFLEFTKDYGPGADLILATGAVCHGIKTEEFQYTDAQELWTYLSKSDHDKYDYIFIAAHGSAKGVYEGRDSDIAMSWSELSYALCGNPGLSEECVVYLGCCKGGLERIANILMIHCPLIYYVCGSECNVTPNEVGIAFRTFCEHHRKGADSKRIVEAASSASGKGFTMYSRYELSLIHI